MFCTTVSFQGMEQKGITVQLLTGSAAAASALAFVQTVQSSLVQASLRDHSESCQHIHSKRPKGANCSSRYCCPEGMMCCSVLASALQLV